MTILLRQKPLPQVVRQIVQRDNGAWFDPSDLSTLYQDAAGTIPVTAVGQPVGKILDKSGNGNHATQSITASRPTLSARYNQLLKSEDLSATEWDKSNNVTVQSNVATGPDGSLTADKLVASNVNTAHAIFQNSPIYIGTAYTKMYRVKAGEYKYVQLALSTGFESSYYCNFDLENGVVGSTKGIVGTIIAIGNGWFECSVTTTATTNALGRVLLIIIPAINSQRAQSFLGDGISGVYVCGADLKIGATKLPYQRVNTATDYDSIGFPKYLCGDGIDDFYNLPFLNLYGNGSCSIVAARDAVSQATDTYIISERSTTDVDPKYFPSRQLASGGNMDSYIVSDEGTVRLDTTGSAFSGAKLAAISSVVDSGSNIKLFKDGAVVADDNYTRAGTLTLNNTTIGASVSTTTSNYENMRLYGLIITKSALSDTDRRRCEQFIASRLSTLGVTLS